MLRNLINEVLENERMSINQLSQKLGLTYANTHALVTREDLSDTKLGTLVEVAKILNVEVTDLYQVILADPEDFREVRILERALELVDEHSKTGTSSAYKEFDRLIDDIEEYGTIDMELVEKTKKAIVKSAKYAGYTNIQHGLLGDISYVLQRLDGELDTHFDKDNLKIIASSGSGNTEYKYSYFEDDFEEWANRHDLTLADIHHLEQYLIECGYKVKEIIEESL